MFPCIAATPPLILLESGKTKAMSLSGALAYHGDGRHVGVVMGFLVIKRFIEAVGAPLERRAISILSGHPGSGMEDAFEFLTRAVREQRYQRVDFPDGPTVAGAPGSFRFDLTAAEGGATLLLRPQVLDPALFSKPNPSDPHDSAKRWDRQSAAIAALLAAPTEALFDTLPLSSAARPS